MIYNIDYGHWDNSKVGLFDPLEHFGFIYLVVNNVTGKKYIGKKQFAHVIKRPPLKGKKNKRHVKKESSWRTYTTSSTYVNEDIKQVGISQFTFSILSLHSTKGSLHYAEVHALVTKGALTERDTNNERTYYNAAIPGVRFIPLVD